LSANAGAGIKLQSGGSINQIVNLGTIRGGTGQNSYGIHNAGGSIGTLINAQGGHGDGSASPDALVYYGDLPQNYGIVLNGPARYGSLAILSQASNQLMTVGIDTAYSTDLSTHRYTYVIYGIDGTNIANERKVLRVTDGVVAALDYNKNVIASHAWDARILNYGVDLAEPQHAALDYSAFALRSRMNAFDCGVFDSSGVCIGTNVSYRGLSVAQRSNGRHSDPTVSLFAAKRLGSHVRVGAFVEFGGGIEDTRGMDVTSRGPTFGGFVGYASSADGSGFQLKLSGAYKRDKGVFQRSNLLGSAETVSAGRGFETVGGNLNLGWGIRFGAQTILTPYLGLVASWSSRLAYSEGAQEAGVLEAPFTYGQFSAKQVSALAGMKLNGQLSPRVLYRVAAGVEHDLSYKLDRFTLNGDFGSSSYASPVKPRGNRANGSIGFGYKLAENKVIALDGSASQYNYGSTAEYTIMVGFRLGF